MSDIVDLYVEQYDGLWNVYFRTPWKGREILDTFHDRQAAIIFAEDQMATANYQEDECQPGRVIVVE